MPFFILPRVCIGKPFQNGSTLEENWFLMSNCSYNGAYYFLIKLAPLKKGGKNEKGKVTLLSLKVYQFSLTPIKARKKAGTKTSIVRFQELFCTKGHNNVDPDEVAHYEPPHLDLPLLTSLNTFSLALGVIRCPHYTELSDIYSTAKETRKFVTLKLIRNKIC